jgi:hypothetical protein
MSAAARPRQLPARSRPTEVPREHGFWVMLGAVVGSALARNPNAAAGLAAVVVVAGAVLAGGAVRRQIRRRASLQLFASLALAAASAPIELAGGAPPFQALCNASAWAAVFSAFTLIVRACLARSSRVRRSEVGILTTLAVFFPLAAALAFVLGELRVQAAAALLGAAVASVIAYFRPDAKSMKPIGLSLAAAAVFVALILAGA